MYPELTVFGLTIELYYAMYGVGVAAALVIGVLTAKRHRFSRLRTVVLTLVGFTFGVVGAKLMSYIYVYALRWASRGAFVPDSSVCLFGALLFLPVFLLPLSRLIRRPAGALLDLLTPGNFVVLAFSKVGCTLGGCCFGVPAAHGIRTPYAAFTAFPVQPLEALSTFAVTAVLLVWLYRSDRRRTGDLYPMGMMLYCFCRFFWEHFRYYAQPAEARFLGPLTFWQTVSLLSFIIGAVWMTALYRKRPEIDFSDPRYAITAAEEEPPSDETAPSEPL